MQYQSNDVTLNSYLIDFIVWQAILTSYASLRGGVTTAYETTQLDQWRDWFCTRQVQLARAVGICTLQNHSSERTFNLMNEL